MKSGAKLGGLALRVEALENNLGMVSKTARSAAPGTRCWTYALEVGVFTEAGCLLRAGADIA